MKHLRQYIRNTILEIYELNPEDKERAEELHNSNAHSRRMLGLQSREEIISDRSELQKYQQKLQSTPEGKKLIKQFQGGKEVTIFHDPGYRGYAAMTGHKTRKEEWSYESKTPITTWLKNYGRRGKDMLSTIAINVPLGQSFPEITHFDNMDVFRTAGGLVMRGYPVFIGRRDVASQTLGALPKGLIDHQKHSGVAKRPGTIDPPDKWPTAIYSDKFKFAGEVLLDNWEVIGTYYDLDVFYPLNSEAAQQRFHEVGTDSLKANLPMYVYQKGEAKTVIQNDLDFQQFKEYLRNL